MKSYISKVKIIAGDFVDDDDEDEDYFSDEKLLEAIQFMKSSGLVPKGLGRPTVPSTAAGHDVALDQDLDIFYLIVYKTSNSGSVWIIDDEKGKAHFASSFTGKFKPDPDVKVFKPGRYQDYMSLKGIQTVLDIVDPGWNGDGEGDNDHLN